VTADFPRPLPALLIAQTLYQDPSQVPSIVAMNDVSNPVFMPTSLTVLSNAG
jgi:prophage DNA circulation protein